MKLQCLIISIGLLAAPGHALAVDTGAVVGGAVGGGAGAAIGSEVGGKTGAIVGGAVGGAAGAAIGASDDEQKVVVKERVIYKEVEHDHAGHPPGYHHGKKKGWKKHH
jgi:outer membrane lipoprotein SlyB